MDLSKRNSKDDHPYGYKTGKDYAEVWCGPCKQLDHFTVTEDDDGSRVEAYTMQDTEYGFTYQVEAYYTKVSSYEPQANYLSEDFDYQYLKMKTPRSCNSLMILYKILMPSASISQETIHAQASSSIYIASLLKKKQQRAKYMAAIAADMDSNTMVKACAMT